MLPCTCTDQMCVSCVSLCVYVVGATGLDPQSAAKVLSATYSAILPISPLPGHTLPRLLCQQLKQQQQQKHHHLGGPSRTSSSASIHTTNTPTATSSNQALVTGSTAAAAAAAVAGVGSGVIVPPTFFGPPSPEADSPWLQLALYAAARAGPVSLVFVAGCRCAVLECVMYQLCRAFVCVHCGDVHVAGNSDLKAHWCRHTPPLDT